MTGEQATYDLRAQVDHDRRGGRAVQAPCVRWLEPQERWRLQEALRAASPARGGGGWDALPTWARELLDEAERQLDELAQGEA